MKLIKGDDIMQICWISKQLCGDWLTENTGNLVYHYFMVKESEKLINGFMFDFN